MAKEHGMFVEFLEDLKIKAEEFGEKELHRLEKYAFIKSMERFVGYAEEQADIFAKVHPELAPKVEDMKEKANALEESTKDFIDTLEKAMIGV